MKKHCFDAVIRDYRRERRKNRNFPGKRDGLTNFIRDFVPMTGNQNHNRKWLHERSRHPGSQMSGNEEPRNGRLHKPAGHLRGSSCYLRMRCLQYTRWRDDAKHRNRQRKNECGKEEKAMRVRAHATHHHDCATNTIGTAAERCAFCALSQCKYGEFGQQIRRVWSANTASLVSKYGEFASAPAVSGKLSCCQKRGGHYLWSQLRK